MRGVRAKRLRFVRDQLAAALPDAGVPVKVRRVGAWAARYQPRLRTAVPPAAWRARATVPPGTGRGVPKVGWGCAEPSEKAAERAATRRRRQEREQARGAA